MKKTFLLIVKYMPIIQVMGFIVNTLLYFIPNVYIPCYIIDFVCGNSLIITALLLVASYALNFCNWHRTLIYTNVINITITTVDACINIPVEEASIVMLTFMIAVIGIVIAIINKFKCYG